MIFRPTFIGAFVLCAALSLAGCGTTGGLPSSSSVDQTIKDVQAGVTQACGWLPTATTVAKIIASLAGGGGVVDVASQAVAGICSALTTKSARRGGGPPRYRGVVISARRV